VERANAHQSIDRIRSELEIVQDKYVHTCGYYLWILPVDTTCGYSSVASYMWRLFYCFILRVTKIIK
jgi:hypothetical protein